MLTALESTVADSRHGAQSMTQPITLQLQPVLQLSEDELLHLCQLNRELRIERTAQGELQIMSPTGGETSARNLKIVHQLAAWAETDGSGIVFESSGGFRLANGAIRSPDASWVRRDRLAQLNPEQRRHFLPLSPDFVLELRSPSDRLQDGRAKLGEYIDQGARLGWLIDPVERQVQVFRPGREPELLAAPMQVSGEDVLVGFVLQLAEVWEPWGDAVSPRSADRA